MQIFLLNTPTAIQVHIPLTPHIKDLMTMTLMNLPSAVIDAVYPSLNSEAATECVFALQIYDWRHVLKRMHRDITVRLAQSNQSESFEWIVDGWSYAALTAVPTRADQLRDIGSFQLLASNLLAIDPCYADVSSGIVVNAKAGKWQTRVLLRDDGHAGYGVAHLAVFHESVDLPSFEPSTYAKSAIGHVGVDSGTCGFFELSQYPTSAEAHAYENGTFYKKCIDALSIDELDQTTVPAAISPTGAGVVCQTYIGDGGYACFVRKDEHDQVIAALLVFDYDDPLFNPNEN